MTYMRLSVLLALTVLWGGLENTYAQDAAPDASRITASETPTLIAPGVVSTAMGEFNPALDLRRNELYFMRRTPGQFDYTLYVSRFEGARWSEPEVVSFSGQYRDDAPYLSPDGQQLFFDSRRPADGFDGTSISLWRVVRDSLGWSGPEFLRGPSVSAPETDKDGEDEFGPAVDATGTLHFYSFRRPFRGGARYIAQPEAYEEVELERTLPDPSAQTFVSYLYLSPDGRTAIMDGLASGRRDSDLYFSCRGASGTWSAPRPLPVVNTNASEGGGWLTADGSLLLFGSSRNATRDSGNLYMVSTSSLPVPCSTE